MIGGVAFALLAGFWLATGLGAVIAGVGWPSVRVRDLIPAWLSWPANTGDPAHGWPRGVRRELGGPDSFYFAAVALAVIPAAFFLWSLSRAEEAKGWFVEAAPQA